MGGRLVFDGKGGGEEGGGREGGGGRYVLAGERGVGYAVDGTCGGRGG